MPSPEGRVVDGKLAKWDIEPASRRKDVIVHEPQRIPVPPIIPVSSHPLRIGVDHSGNNVFNGRIGRVTLFRGSVSSEMVAALAGGDRNSKVTGKSVVCSTLAPEAGDVLTTDPADFGGPISLEAWIQPAERESGRILDKLTAGRRDGFLLDCWPNLALRLIVGPQEVVHKSVLKPGAWQHVAVVIDRHRTDVYLDGVEL